jgi:23S rRNA (guanosine2251-2'-O)-methyltransferase
MNLIVGRKPVLEALKSGEQLDKIYLLYGQKGDIIYEIKKLSRQYKIHITELSLNKFKIISSSSNTQGVIALKSLQKYFSVDDIINKAKEAIYPTILVLDSIQDPHNLGAILRTAECAGIRGILITIHESAVINETVVKTSAGATEHLMIAKVSNLSQTLDILKDNGFWIVGTSLLNSKDYINHDYKMPIAVIVGNEEKGIRPIITKKCDFMVKIPLMGKLQSLNVSVDSCIILYEMLRQRNK